MKLPNGYGSVVKMSGKRRKPYAVRITDGTKLNKDGRRIQKYRFLEYFENRSDALTYLANYNSNSAIKEHSEYIKNPTLREMYDEWITLRTSGKNAISPLTRRNYDIAINRFEKLHMVKARYNEKKKYLISNKFGNHYTYGVFYDSFNTTIKRLGMKHNPHDCRHTFASLADNVQMNEVCLKKIMGHSIQDITKGVYTDKTPAELLAEVQKLNDLF